MAHCLLSNWKEDQGGGITKSLDEIGGNIVDIVGNSSGFVLIEDDGTAFTLGNAGNQFCILPWKILLRYFLMVI